MNALTRLQAIRDELKARFIERDELVDAALLALLSRQHLLLIGPPGSAKSMLARELCQRIGGTYFEWLLTKFTTPEEIFGPLDLNALEQGRYERVTTHKLPEAEIAFLDEVFKANSAILNALLTILNERRFYQGSEAQAVPLRTLVAASNELPEEEELDALYDRFLLRFVVGYVEREDRFRQLLTLDESPDPAATSIDAKSLTELQSHCDGVRVPNGILAELTVIRRHLNARGVMASDRRYRQSLSVLRAAAFLDGRDSVSHRDLAWLEHLLWSDPEERLAVLEVLSELSSGLEEEARKLLRQAKEVEAYARRQWPDDSSRQRAQLEAHAKLEDIHRRLSALAEQARERGRDASALQADDDKVVAIQRDLLASEQTWLSLDPTSTVVADGYDREVFERALTRSSALRDVNERLGRLLPHPQPLVRDLFCALFKLNTLVRPVRELQPSVLINRQLVEMVVASGQLEALRRHTALDETNAAAATASLARRLLDALRRAFKNDPKALVDAAEAAHTEDMLSKRQEALEHLERAEPFDERDNDAMAEELRDEVDKLQARLRRERRRQDEAARIAEQVEGAVEVGLERTREQLESRDQHAQGLGLNASTSVDVDRRLELGDRIMSSDKLQRLARLVGAMREVAFESRKRRAARAPQEMHAVTLGDELSRLLPSEMLGLKRTRAGAIGQALHTDFLRRYAERQLLQFHLEAPSDRGPMIICLDGSGSMQGAKELWGKAVALTLMEIARRERRRCLALIFSSGHDLFEVELLRRGRRGARARVRDDEVLKFAEHFPGGGTDFEEPLTRAVESVTEGDYRRGDIVFVTDGQARVSASLIERIAALKRRHRFKIRAILVDVGEHEQSGVEGFADDVRQVTDLASDAIGDLFAAV